MDGHTLKDVVMDRLARVRTGTGGTDVVSAGIIRSVEVDPDGDARISVSLRPGDDPGIADSGFGPEPAIDMGAYEYVP